MRKRSLQVGILLKGENKKKEKMEMKNDEEYIVALSWKPVCGARVRPDPLWKKIMDMPYNPQRDDIADTKGKIKGK